MVRRFGSFVAAWGVVAVVAGGSFAAEEATSGFARLDFKPVPGVQEFSGQMIARPVQQEKWLERGLSADQATTRGAAARTAMKRFTLIEYVRQTDEYVFEVPQGQTENTVANALMATGDFQYVHPNWTVYPIGCPNDPRLRSQWHHNANRLQSCDGWELHTGDPTTSVGICDTGIRTTHEEFRLHRLEGYNAVDRRWESQGGRINDINGHGTSTTGCAAANGNNGVGVSGVGWDLAHRMLRVSNSSGGNSSLATLNHAARTAVLNGDKVASVSYSGVNNATNRATATYIKSKGGLLVWAAGNDNRRLAWGNRDDDDIIVVGGTDQSDRKYSASAWGPSVDLVAPAVSVYTTKNSGNSSYGGATGTSFACPLTAGLVALIFSAQPSFTPDDVEDVLKNGCDDLGAPGVDDTFGYGRINVYNSIFEAAGDDPAACCFSDGSCKNQKPAKCRQKGGRSNFGEKCGSFDCPQPGACCVDNSTCLTMLEKDCLVEGGDFRGEGVSCELACPCDLIRKFRAKCTNGGRIKALVKFKNRSRDGETVEIKAGERGPFEVDIKGKKAKLSTCCYKGPIEVSLIDPEGCVDPIKVKCPE